MPKLKIKKSPFAKYKKEVFQRLAKVSDFIFQIGESVDLRMKSKKVNPEKINTQEIQTKIKYLKNCLIKYRKLTGYGRGIAAVQVGIPESFAITYTPNGLITIINPKITKRSKKRLLYPEMCMSAAPVIAPVIRPSWIEFEYYNEVGELKSWNTKDDSDLGRMLNRVFQHEIDHLEGVINVDLVESPKELMLKSDPSFYKKAKFETVIS